jgi:hypothetical protein
MATFFRLWKGKHFFTFLFFPSWKEEIEIAEIFFQHSFHFSFSIELISKAFFNLLLIFHLSSQKGNVLCKWKRPLLYNVTWKNIYLRFLNSSWQNLTDQKLHKYWLTTKIMLLLMLIKNVLIREINITEKCHRHT